MTPPSPTALGAAVKRLETEMRLMEYEGMQAALIRDIRTVLAAVAAPSPEPRPMPERRVDEDGCYILPNGECIGCLHCPHSPTRHAQDEPLYDEQAEADSFDEFYKAFSDEARRWNVSPDVQLAISAALTEPHKRLWTKLRDAGRQANVWAEAALSALRGSVRALLETEGDGAAPIGSEKHRRYVTVRMVARLLSSRVATGKGE